MVDVNRYYYRRRGPRSRSRAEKGYFYENARLDPKLKPLFRKIGVPGPAPFKPDPFQLEAVEKLAHDDVLVSAPTGSGKTWIAIQAIHQYLSRGMRVWYASPLKALSNSIYNQFRDEFGRDNCGILTGDRKENPQAPVIVGTTEILRNQLYDAMHQGVGIAADLVVLDEAHYLSDPERGVVWEEVLIYLPFRVRLLLLSATVSNAGEVCAWLEINRGRGPLIVKSEERPVALEMLFLFPDGLIVPLGGRHGLNPAVRRFISPGAGRWRGGSNRIDFGKIISSLRKFDLLPAIFFLKSRMDCNRALPTCPPVKNSSQVQRRIETEVAAFLERYPHLEGHRQMDALLYSHVAAHHAGQLPYWKVLVERIMNKGCLDAIFSTSTVAAGVNFPARSVVLVQSDRFDGHEFADLTATELHQMIGRAGRRGKDNIGFVLVVPGLHQDPQLIQDLRDSPPEPLMSQIHINFSMSLNLLLSHRPREIKELLERSFAAFQNRQTGSSIRQQWETLIEILFKTLPKRKCDTEDPHEIMEMIRNRSDLMKKARELARELRQEAVMAAYREYLRPGRLFRHRKGGTYIVFHTFMEKGRLFCAAHNLRKTVKERKSGIRLRKVPYEGIRYLYDRRVNLPEDYSAESLQSLFDSIGSDGLEILDIEIPRDIISTEDLDNVQKSLEALPCQECPHLKECHAVKNNQLRKILNDLRSVALQMEGIGGGLWIAFKRHLRFLKETGFVDEADRLTPDGFWASKLRLDHPLLIADAIRKGGFEGDSPEVLAGCIGPFVWDRVQEIELDRSNSPLPLDELEVAFRRLLDSIEEIRELKVKRHFENPKIFFWPAVVVYLWAKGLSWDRITSFIQIDDGDLASLIVRSADHLRQVSNLSQTHPDLASTAERAIDLILREPIYIG